MAKVFVTGFLPGDEHIVDVASYIGEAYQVPEGVRRKKLDVYRIDRYDADGRAFCYMLTVTEQGLGGLHALTFRDEDGDGKFEVIWEGGLDESAYSPPVPEWARK